MKSLCVAILSTFVILGLGASAIAQQPATPAIPETQAADKATDAQSSSSAPARTEIPPAVPAPDRSSSSSTGVDVKTEPRSDAGQGDAASAAPRTTVESRRIFGLEPKPAVLIGAAILLVVVLALVAMARGGETVSHTDDH